MAFQGVECQTEEQLNQFSKKLRFYLPKHRVNYEKTEGGYNSMEISIDSYQVLQLDTKSYKKQDFFISKSEIEFEDKWDSV